MAVPPGFPDTPISEFITSVAEQLGIDPTIALRVADSEGGLTQPAVLGDFSGPPLYSGKSWWPFQLHYGGAGTPYASYGHTAGMGNDFTAQYGWQPGDPAAWQASIIYALNRAAAGGWGVPGAAVWAGAVKQGITGFMGISRRGASLPVPHAGQPYSPPPIVVPPIDNPPVEYPPTDGWQPPPPPPIILPPYQPPTSYVPPPAQPPTSSTPGRGLFNLPDWLTLPDVTLGNTPGGGTVELPGGQRIQLPGGQPIKVNLTGAANAGVRLWLSALALGLVAIGLFALGWQATPQPVKQAAKTAVLA